jgi:nucleotide-binding universal stress UspA family protein
MKTILLATDFPPAALNAANYGTDMAMAQAAKIILLHVYEIPVAYAGSPAAYTVDDARHDAESCMTRFKDAVSTRALSVLTIITLVRPGAFFEELEKACEEYVPDIVIMGSQGTTALDRLMLGGHSVHAMKHLIWPLITVPLHATYSGIKKIGLACDVEKLNDSLPITDIRILVEDFNAKLYVLNTCITDNYSLKFVHGSNRLFPMLHDLNPEYHFIGTKDVEAGITGFAVENRLDMLIMMPKTHSLIDRILQKSHTRKMVLHCPVPIIALH